MARKPVLFRPKLFVPQGLNNYPGKAFRCFTMGDTLPFRFTFRFKDGTELDVTDWQVKVAMAPTLDASEGLEASIPLVDADNKIFEGEVTSVYTKLLSPGIHYAVAKYITAAGNEHVIDMCILEVYQNLDFVTV